jgi:serpin B
MKASLLISLILAAGIGSAQPGYAQPPARPGLGALVDANNAFALNLYRQLASEQAGAGQNLFFSPYSMSAALCMTLAGAKGQTADEMRTVLALSSISGQDAASLFGQLNTAIKPADPKVCQLTVANALWGEKTFPFRKDFVDLIAKSYQGNLTNLDLINASEPSRQQINQWVEEQTNQRIKDLLAQGTIDALTRLVLTNAIYFKGQWTEAFEKNKTKPLPFIVSPGNMVQVPMMFKHATSIGHCKADSLAVAQLPYKGGELYMIVLLPDAPDGLPALEKQLTVGQLDLWISSVKTQKVNLYLPRFTMTRDYSMNKPLQALGMKQAFLPGGADFTGLSDSPDAKELFVSAVVHKAFVEVNEEGTEAAAATGVVVGLKMAPMATPTFRADHPFLFLIRHDKTGEILFLGRFSQPVGSSPGASASGETAPAPRSADSARGGG